MKKFLTLFLAVVTALAMSTTAFAVTMDNTSAPQEIDVNAKYVDGVSAPDIYSVDVSWGAMEFTYTVSGTKTWDPSTHEYEVSTVGEWSESGNTVTVTNHSNDGVTVTFDFEALDAYSTVSGAFSKGVAALPSAEGMALDAAELTASTELTLSGTLSDSVTALTKVGTVTVTIS